MNPLIGHILNHMKEPPLMKYSRHHRSTNYLRRKAHEIRFTTGKINYDQYNAGIILLSRK